MRQVIIHCHDADGSWKETYREGEKGSFQVGELDLVFWAHRLIDRFNATLRPNERTRYVDRVEVADIDDPNYRPEHAWSKTNAVTISDRHGLYDKMVCTECGVTAKRFGVDRLVIDSKYRAKKYQRCSRERVA